MSSRSAEPAAALGDLLRSRPWALLPVGVISSFGLAIYLFFSSTPYDSSNLLHLKASPQHPHFRIDDLGRVGIPSFGPTDDAAQSDINQNHGPQSLMSLPILQKTFRDPFNPRGSTKQLHDPRFPWSANTSTGVILINRLSKNRFPSADALDPDRGSSPPPIPPWPSAELLKDKPNWMRSPIPKEKIFGLNTSFVWTDRTRIKHGRLPKVQWSGFDRPGWESESDRAIRVERQSWVRRAFQHVWEGYKANAWGHDELKPISGTFQDPFAGWGATLVDCLSVLSSIL